MDIEEIRTYCLTKKMVTESLPFGPEVLVFKVLDKIFCLLSLDHPTTLNLKAEPLQAEEWRAQYPDVVPGYHMNKKHWNTISLNGSLSNVMILNMIDHSYHQVINGMTKKEKEILKEM